LQKRFESSFGIVWGARWFRLLQVAAACALTSAAPIHTRAAAPEPASAVADGPAELPRLMDEHVDLRVLYHPDRTPALELVVRDADQRVVYGSHEVILVAREEARITLPPGFELFGPAGASLWILPQSLDDRLLFLGTSGENLPPQLFPEGLSIQLRAVDGPGSFFAWQATQFGELAVRLNSRDGIDSSDRLTLRAAGHDHYNWAFTAPGIYRIIFQVVGKLFGQTDPAESAETSVTFHVLPLPEPDSPIRLVAEGFNGQGQFQMTLHAPPERTYRIEASADLSTWQAVLSVTTSTPATAILDADATVHFHRFYRAVAVGSSTP
jgi:surface-anchored protein